MGNKPRNPEHLTKEDVLNIVKKRKAEPSTNSEARFKAQYEREKQLLAESRNLFNYDELVNSADIPRKVVLPDFGFHVEYCPLTSKERNEVFALKHHDPLMQLDMRNRKSLSMMMQKAMPHVKNIEAKVDKLPATWIDAIMIQISKEERAFLPQIVNDALLGLNRTQKPRKS
jgi:hypothetical protein